MKHLFLTAMLLISAVAVAHDAPVIDFIKYKNPRLEIHEDRDGKHYHEWCYDGVNGEGSGWYQAVYNLNTKDPITDPDPVIEPPKVVDPDPIIEPPKVVDPPTQPDPVITYDPTPTPAPASEDGGASFAHGLENATTADEHIEVSEPTAAGSIGNYAPCGKASPLRIISVVELRNPRRLVVKIRNASPWAKDAPPSSKNKFVSLRPCYRIVLTDADGKLKVGSTFEITNSDPYITYQKSQHEEHADTFFYLLPKFNFGKLDTKSDSELLGEWPRFATHFQYYFGKQTGYTAGDVLILYKGQKEITRFSEAVAMSPSLKRTLTTSWGAVKTR